MSEKNDEERIQSFRKAAAIYKSVLAEYVQQIKPNLKLIEIAKTIEKRIEEGGGAPAFPVNIAIGNIAAHYTPLSEDDGVIPSEEVIKVDFGVHVNGYSVDAARTFYFGDDPLRKEMINVVNEALKLAIENFKVGERLSTIGAIIEDFVTEHGFKVIQNLNGHLIEQWNLHGEKEVPTSKELSAPGVIESGEVYAIEIFVTNGEGKARARDEYRIYSLIPELPRRIPIHIKIARDILRYINRTRKGLPFTLRWLKNQFSDRDIKVGIAVLESTGLLIRYPVLEEKEGSIVVQAEDTVLVKKDGIEVLTSV